MTERRPLALVSGQIRELPTGDTLPADVVATGGALIDGGSPSTSSTGLLRIDFGAVT